MYMNVVRMRSIGCLLAAVSFFGIQKAAPAANPPLSNGKFISPKPIATQDVGSLPMNVIVSPDGQHIVVSDMGYYQSLWSISTDTGKGVSHIDFPNRISKGKKSTESNLGNAGPAMGASAILPGRLKSNGLYYGLAMDGHGTLYAAQGSHDSIAILHMDGAGRLSLLGGIRTRSRDFPAGLALDHLGRLYVANNASGSGDPFKLTGSVAIYDTKDKKELGRYTFAASHYGTSNFPLGIAALRDGSKCYVAAERDNAVYVLDTQTPSKPTLIHRLDTGEHPVAVLLNSDQTRLFVANSLSDTISVIDTGDDKIVGTVLLRPRVARDVPGVSPIALALSPDGKTLYAALGDMNAAAVIDPVSMELLGYIRAGWYPSALAVSPDGKRLLIANAKGTVARNPNNIPNPHIPKSKSTPILQILAGNVTSVQIPSTPAQLKDETQEVLKDNRLIKLEHPKPNPLADIGLAAGKIKHVIYIVKENRTYDQILGDMPEGNGDPSLCLFGQQVTPNDHALARRFVLLDNIYASGEVSGDGWDWSTQGMADAYVVRNIPYEYSGRGRKYDTEGENNGFPTAGIPSQDQDGKVWANPSFKKATKPIPDVGNTGHNIWDAARQAGVTFRNYGFFLDFADNNAGVPGGPDNYPAAVGLEPAGHDLAGLTDLDYRRFDLDFADSDAEQIYYKKSHNVDCLYKERTYGKYHLPCRFDEWKREFDMMLAKDPTGGAVPSLILLRLPEDHNHGASGGRHTPASYTADNDYALGEIVQTVSHSAIWNSTAIFVIEDDAQAGVDHVDCHRTTAYVISPWIKAHSVDHHFYNTDSMLKTMELILGLKPLSQYDAVADPIMDWTKTPDNEAPYAAILPPEKIIAALNPTKAQLRAGDPRLKMEEASDAMNFYHDDAAPAQELNVIVWKTVKGANSVMPAPRGLQWTPDDDDD